MTDCFVDTLECRKMQIRYGLWSVEAFNIITSVTNYNKLNSNRFAAGFCCLFRRVNSQTPVFSDM